MSAAEWRLSLRRMVARAVHEVHCGKPPTCGVRESWARGSTPRCEGQLSGREIDAVMDAVRAHPIGARVPVRR